MKSGDKYLGVGYEASNSLHVSLGTVASVAFVWKGSSRILSTGRCPVGGSLHCPSTTACSFVILGYREEYQCMLPFTVKESLGMRLITSSQEVGKIRHFGLLYE